MALKWTTILEVVTKYKFICVFNGRNKENSNGAHSLRYLFQFCLVWLITRITQTIRFLSSGFLSRFLMHSLCSSAALKMKISVVFIRKVWGFVKVVNYNQLLKLD